ncbi:MAG TPA: hypothetical protein VFO35_17120, partial [Steroidobacteraceae bacterium]|nr:hypothetical protein [Steroidobacteraceae bacterium]
IMTNTKLRQQSVNRPDLYSLLSTVIAQACRRDMILSIGRHQWDRRKPVYDLLVRLGALKSLEQFLQHEPRCHHTLAGLEGADQSTRRSVIGYLIPIPTQH